MVVKSKGRIVVENDFSNYFEKNIMFPSDECFCAASLQHEKELD